MKLDLSHVPCLIVVKYEHDDQNGLNPEKDLINFRTISNNLYVSQGVIR